MADWFSSLANQALQYADSLTDSLVTQANEAQAQILSEQEKFKKEKEKENNQLKASSKLPWETDDEALSILSDELMNKVFSLSLNEKNFTTTPANASDIDFSFQMFIPVAMNLLKLDANLARNHSKLSPKMDEAVFWKNYYCRIVYLRALSGIDGPIAKQTAIQYDKTEIIYEPLEPSNLQETPISIINTTNVKSSEHHVKPTSKGNSPRSNLKEEEEIKLNLEEEEDQIDINDLDDMDLLGELGDLDGEDYEEIGESDCDDELAAQIALELAEDKL